MSANESQMAANECQMAAQRAAGRWGLAMEGSQFAGRRGLEFGVLSRRPDGAWMFHAKAEPLPGVQGFNIQNRSTRIYTHFFLL